MSLNEPLLSKRRVAVLLDLHPASVMRLVRSGKFPKPIHTSGTSRGHVRWRPQDVEQWLIARAS